MRRFKYFFIGAMLLSFSATAQFTKEDYAKADSVMKRTNLVYNEVYRVNWLDSTTLWYGVKTRDKMEYKLVDAEKETVIPLFDTGKLVEVLNKKQDKKVTEKSLALRELKYEKEKQMLHFLYNNKAYFYSIKDNKLTTDSLYKPRKPNGYWNGETDELGNKPVASPDKKWTSFIKNYNVYIKNNENQKEYQLSYDGSPGDYYSSYLFWSPDSKHLAVNKVRKNEARYIYFVESSPKNQLQPILHKRYYLKPGDALPIKHPALFDVENKTQIPVNSLAFENQYELTNPKWNKSGTAFTFEYNQRGHQVYQVVAVDAQTGKTSVIINEQSKTFIDYSGKKYRYDLEDTNEMIWASERDGWNHLYLFDAKTGALKNQLTKGKWVVRKVLYVDEKNRTVFFYGSGKNKGEDPYFLHCYKVNFNGKGLKDLTPEKMNHNVSFSKDFHYFVDTYSTVDTPSETVLRSADGKVILDLEKTDITDLLATGWNAPEPFVAKARDGKTDIWGNIYRPSNFDKNKTYPVIEYIYAGPQGAFAQKSFRAINWSFSGLAELGFIVVQMDGMGTSYRSKAFHDVCYKNLKDAGFPDRILWIKAAAEKYPYMDTTRVGIFGASAGGQNTLSGLLFHPGFYKAGVASCGCQDNRMDKMWWNEQWMGYPIGPQYAECSNVVNAYRLQGKLMLIVGEMDDNVDPASTLQVADALIKAKKDFELVVLPGSNHTLGGTYGEQKRRDFFVRNLLHKETPDWNTTSGK